MGDKFSNFINSRPQSLCLQCGTCCRVATVPETHEEMLQLAEEGNESAIDFLSLFVPYESIEEAKKVSESTVDNILCAVANSDNLNKQVTFYKCRYINDDGRCSNYLNRPDVCKRFPATAWAVAPPGCGFEGWIRERRLEIVANVKEQKEIVASLEQILPVMDDAERKAELEKTVEKAKKNIEKYEKYGSNKW